MELEIVYENSTPPPPSSPPPEDKGQDDEKVIRMDEDNVLVDQSNESMWDAERRHYLKIVTTFRKYGANSIAKLRDTVQYVKSLPKEHQRLLVDYRKHLVQVKKCVEENQNLCELIVMDHAHLFENQNEVYPKKKMKQRAPEPTSFDFEKLQGIFKHIVRDWAEDGKRERETCYEPIIEEIERMFGDTKDEEGLSPIKILVPGAGLGRLAHELVRKGYTVEGNEFSLYMLLTSNFILNKCASTNQFQCFPWVHQTTNVLNREDQVRPVSFPDISPSELPPNSKFSMTAGDFLEVYSTPPNRGGWDCVASCFFIDCANNIVAYLERIYSCLKIGGLWVNLGPLLYHFADMANEQSIEPSYDIVRDIIVKMGFIIEKEETNKPTFYADNDKSMLTYSYHSVFLVCRKGPPPDRSLPSTPIKCMKLDEDE